MRRFVVTLVATLTLCAALSACSSSGGGRRSAASIIPSGRTAATSTSPASPRPTSSLDDPSPLPHVAPRHVAKLVALMHANRASWDLACEQVVGTPVEISVVNFHRAVGVHLTHPHAQRSDQFECTYARPTRNGRSLFRVYVRRSSPDDQASGYTGDVRVTAHGVRLELSPDDTGDTDISLPIGGDAARAFLLDVASRVER